MQWTWGAIFDVIATGSAHISLLGGNDTHDSRSVFNDHHHHHHQNDSPRGARCRGSGGPCVPPPPARCPRAGWPVNITTTITISITTTIIVIVVLYLFSLTSCGIQPHVLARRFHPVAKRIHATKRLFSQKAWFVKRGLGHRSTIVHTSFRSHFGSSHLGSESSV